MSEIPAEVMLGMLRQVLVTYLGHLWYAMEDRAGALTMNQVWVDSWRHTGVALGPDVVKALNITEKDAAGAAKLVQAVKSVLGIECEIKEVSPKRSVVYVTRCPIYENIKGTDLEWELRCEYLVCIPFLSGLAQAINPNLTFTCAKTMRGGTDKEMQRYFAHAGDHCELVIELP